MPDRKTGRGLFLFCYMTALREELSCYVQDRVGYGWTWANDGGICDSLGLIVLLTVRWVLYLM